MEPAPTRATLSAATEPALPDASFEGGIAIDQVAMATALAQCSYWNRCTPLAPSLVSDCVQTLVQYGVWSCMGYDYLIPNPFPSPDLLQKVAAGLVEYDPWQESICLQAVRSAPCTGLLVQTQVSECAGAFYTIEDTDSSDGGVKVPCWPFLCGTEGGTMSLPPAYSSDADCTAADGGFGGPYCYASYCSLSPCGEAFENLDGTCVAFADAGQLCDSDPPFLGLSHV